MFREKPKHESEIPFGSVGHVPNDSRCMAIDAPVRMPAAMPETLAATETAIGTEDMVCNEKRNNTRTTFPLLFCCYGHSVRREVFFCQRRGLFLPVRDNRGSTKLAAVRKKGNTTTAAAAAA